MKPTDFTSRLQGVKPAGDGKFSARCPAHEDRNASLSIATGDDGRTLLHCHAGCETPAIVGALGLKLVDLFAEKSARYVAVKPVPKPAAPFNWQPCVDAFAPAKARELAEWRGFSPEFVAWLHGKGIVGLHRGNLAFAVHDEGGKVISCHALIDRAAKKWIYTPSGKGTRPLIFGDVRRAGFVFCFESQWDAFAVMDKLGWHSADGVPDAAVIVTRGADNGKLMAGQCSPDAIVYAFVQNDAPKADGSIPAEKWLADVAAHAGGKVVRVVTPAQFKDANDWTRAGATKAEIESAMLVGKQVHAPDALPAVTPETADEITSDNLGDESNHHRSDIGYADNFVAAYGDSIRFCSDEKSWLVFDVARGWQRDFTGQIKAMSANYARRLYRDALTAAADLEFETGKRLISSVVALGNRKRIDAMLSFAAVDPRVVLLSAQLDADPFLVGVENGVVDLCNGEFQPHRREHLVTRRLAVKFDASATAPTWEKFLAEVQPNSEMRGFLQRLSGYGLTGETRDHVLPFHFGTGANGKGTFLEHALLKLAGSYGAKLTDSLVYTSARGNLPHLELANLCGKRFTLGEENAAGGKLNEALLKSITGGDRQKGRFHYGNFVEYFPTYKIALVGNHKPRIDGTDDGIWRRFLLVDWPVQIPAERRDARLKDKLAAEMPGILNWGMAGARAWLADGLNPPASCLVATAEFRQGSDSLVEFISDNFTKDPDGYVTKADAFDAYQHWARHQGLDRPMSKRALGFQLVNRGWQEFVHGHGKSKCWAGFQIVHQPERGENADAR